MAHAKLKADHDDAFFAAEASVASSGLDAAAARLASSLARLEDAINCQPEGVSDDGQADLFRQENNQLKAEKDQLTQALAQMKQRYAQLKLATMKVAERLDQAIERMDKLAS